MFNDEEFNAQEGSMEFIAQQHNGTFEEMFTGHALNGKGILSYYFKNPTDKQMFEDNITASKDYQIWTGLRPGGALRSTSEFTFVMEA